MLIITAVFLGKGFQTWRFRLQNDEKGWTNEMLRVPVYSGVLKLKNVNKKGLCCQA